ncbi:alpha/beta hydrolase family protein [Paenibacillus daejeonensis]|uniref:alpha/beta hydrolase family protein n=1 Tax=Paenibacillus daejeonensis TaxID=135193 RepID=UPI00037D4245|nr:alpha/beta hydrolase [Paenibacillus daejeonensis]
MAVGRKIVALNDISRKDPFADGETREIITSIYYPADVTHAQIGFNSYLDLFDPCKEMASIILQDMGVDIEYLASLPIVIINDATPNLVHGRRPVILFSPGFGVTKDMYSYHVEELVCSGFVVISIGSTYESIFTIFPDSRYSKQIEVLSNIKDSDYSLWQKLLKTRVEDILFVIKHLDLLIEGTNLGDVNWDDIGIVGHSLGGAAAFEVAKKDKRIRAGVMLDASFHLLNAKKNTKLGTPFLVMRQEKCTYDELLDELPEEIITSYIQGYERTCNQLVGNRYTVKVQGAHHMTFSDIPLHYKELNVSEKHKTICSLLNAFLKEFLQGQASSFQDIFYGKRPNGIKEIDIKGNLVNSKYLS